MWALTNQTPFAAERAFARARDGAEVWVVAVKATFHVEANGALRLAEQQEPVHAAAVYWGEPGKSSLRFAPDLLLTKPGTDVILHGHAVAPGGKPVREIQATMAAGPIKKTLRVVGDRIWKGGLLRPRLSDPVPFERMPLLYERAYGGSSEEPLQREGRNPVGRGFARRKGDLLGRPAPNIEYPGDAVRPAGFGPIAPDWSPRRERAGTYDEAWQETRLPLVPHDFDDHFFHSAPDDQQVTGYLTGGERVELRNLTPEGRLRFELPKIALGFATRFGRYRENHRAVLHTLVLEPDLARFQMVWQTTLPCHFTVYSLKDTTVFLKRRIGSLANLERMWASPRRSPITWGTAE